MCEIVGRSIKQQTSILLANLCERFHCENQVSVIRIRISSVLNGQFLYPREVDAFRKSSPFGQDRDLIDRSS